MASVTRWRRYGHDRLYATDDDGTRLGYYDVTAASLHPDAPGAAERLRDVLKGHPLYRPATPPGHGAAPERGDGHAGADGAAASPPPGDLAANAPGAAARRRAAQERAEANRTPVRALLQRALDLPTTERAWRRGAEGEESVGARLERLAGHGWRVLHAVPVGRNGADIDHVLVGPGGLYTINTKNHRGKRIWVGAEQIRVNGAPVPYLRNSRHEAERASRLLSNSLGCPVRARPVLVILTGTLLPTITFAARPTDVLVLERLNVPNAFRRAPRRLDPDIIERIWQAARNPATWQV